jgi:hypothetical protein
MSRSGSTGSGTTFVELQELAQRMLADYDARTPGQLVGEPFYLTTVQAYALQATRSFVRRSACSPSCLRSTDPTYPLLPGGERS